MAGLYNGHLLEFPQIRVDCFTAPPPASRPQWTLPHPLQPHLPHRPAPPAQLYLLTHVHSDHLIGLSDTFTGHIICSPDTKRMLLKLESEKERDLVVKGSKERPRRKYEGLKARVEGKGTKDERVVDRIEAVPYGVPKRFELGYDARGEAVEVTITLLDANHCPGSTMFLVTSLQYAVLHTGDIRADDIFLQSLRRQPSLGEFLVPWTNAAASSSGGEPLARGARRQLDRIYIDTSCILGTGDMPDKEQVIRDLVDQMSMYPPEAVFFLNVWCFGWEDVVKEVARNFSTLVHVDRYKHQIYKAVRSDPFLSACTTLDHTATRFHACERRAKCSACIKFDEAGHLTHNIDKLVVSVNMVEIKSAAWEMDKRTFLDKLGKAACGEGGWPFNIDIPFARHSPLPELQALTKMFRPKSLSPNTMYPQADGLEFYLLPELFKDCLLQEGHLVLTSERDAWFSANPKYGPDYLDRMRTMQAAGMELVPDLAGGSERDERYREPYDVSDNPGPIGAIKRGRRSDAVEQLSRAGGLPRMSVGDLSSILMSVNQNGSAPGLSSLIGKGGIRVHIGPAAALPAMPDGWKGSPASIGQASVQIVVGRTEKDDDYDTEEESGGRRKRQRYYAARVSPKPELEAKDDPEKPVAHHGSQRTLISPSPTKKGNQPVPSPSLSDKKPEVKVEATPAIPPSSGSGSAQSSQPRPSAETRHRPVPRFFIDKEHLRAYARAAAEVDDL